MMTKKPGPPVPPRPHTTHNFMKSYSESSSTIAPSTAAKRFSKVITSSSSSDAGRTVIYKSPSFDLKKRQEDQCLQDQQDQNCVKQQSQQQQIFISDNHNESNAFDKNRVTIENKTNRTEIVIINSNNRSKQYSKSSSIDSFDKNYLKPSSIQGYKNNNETITDEDLPAQKISPVPKPRTLMLAKQPKFQSLDTLPSVTKTRSTDIITINNKPEAVAIKNIEVENNLKNAAERLFTEIIINQTKHSNSNKNNDQENKTEHYISVRDSPERCHHPKQQPPPPPIRTCPVVNLSYRPEPEGGETNNSTQYSSSTTTTTNGHQDPFKSSEISSTQKKVAFHEILISELTAMRKDSSTSIDHDDSDDRDLIEQIDKMKKRQDQQKKPQRKRYPSACSTDSSPYGTQRSSRIRTSDWVEVGDNGKEVMLTSCHICLEDSGMEDEERLDDTSSGVGDSWDSVKDAEERMSLPGLPPLPKSLSGLELTGVPVHNSTTGSLASLESHRGISPLSRMTATQGGTTTTTTTSTLDNQLAVLRREMFGLRQLDLSLLSQLWALNESIQEFRTMLQEQETLSPPSPSPSPSDANSVSSGDEDDISSIGKSQIPTSMQRMRMAPPPPPPTRMPPQRPV